MDGAVPFALVFNGARLGAWCTLLGDTTTSVGNLLSLGNFDTSRRGDVGIDQRIAEVANDSGNHTRFVLSLSQTIGLAELPDHWQSKVLLKFRSGDTFNDFADGSSLLHLRRS